MNVIIFGGTGMVGQGVFRECLLDPDVQHVLSIVRSPRDARRCQARHAQDRARERGHQQTLAHFMMTSAPFVTPWCNSGQDRGGNRFSVYSAESRIDDMHVLGA